LRLKCERNSRFFAFFFLSSAQINFNFQIFVGGPMILMF
jgi:hypothetical protein